MEEINMDACNRNIQRALKLARQLTLLADIGEQGAEDDSCIVLYGIIRDCAYKIRHAAQEEKKQHQLQGKWANATLADPPQEAQ